MSLTQITDDVSKRSDLFKNIVNFVKKVTRRKLFLVIISLKKFGLDFLRRVVGAGRIRSPDKNIFPIQVCLETIKINVNYNPNNCNNSMGRTKNKTLSY